MFAAKTFCPAGVESKEGGHPRTPHKAVSGMALLARHCCKGSARHHPHLQAMCWVWRYTQQLIAQHNMAP